MIDDYLHDEDVARLLGLDVRSLRNKLSSGDPLPPNITLPGIRARIWPRQEFDQWVRQFLVAVPENSGPGKGKHQRSTRK